MFLERLGGQSDRIYEIGVLDAVSLTQKTYL